MREFLKGANYERCKWLAVMLLGISVVVLNAHLKSVPTFIYRAAVEFISGLEERKLS